MADVVIVGPGTSKAIATGIAAAGKGATVVQFTATPPDDDLLVKPHDLYFNETRLVPSYSCGPEETREALSLVERGVINATRTGDASLSAGADNRGVCDRAKARVAEGDSNLRELSCAFQKRQKPELTTQSGIRIDRQRGRLPMQPPSLLSSLCEITEWQEPVLERHCQPVPAPRPHRTEPLPLPRDGECGSEHDDAAPTSSSTRSLLRDPQPPSHRWPPALRGWPPPEPALPMPPTSGPPRRRVPLPGQPGSPR